MKTFTAVIALLAGAAMAHPSPPSHPSPPNPGNNGGAPACPSGLYSNPQCCATDVLGVADLDCSNPSSASSLSDFKSSCASTGKSAVCCVIPVAGQSLLCTKA